MARASNSEKALRAEYKKTLENALALRKQYRGVRRSRYVSTGKSGAKTIAKLAAIAGVGFLVGKLTAR